MIVLRWDWKDEPDWNRLNMELKGWEGPICFNRVNTDSDSYAVVVSHGVLSESEIQTVYNNWVR